MRDYLFEENFLSFIHNSLECRIQRHHFGFLLAYVYIPKHNEYYGMDEYELNQKIKIDREITFAEEENGKWKIGFDFGSINDFIPYEPDNEFKKFVDQFQKQLGMAPATEKDYKNMSHVIEKIKGLAEKLYISRN